MKDQSILGTGCSFGQFYKEMGKDANCFALPDAQKKDSKKKDSKKKDVQKKDPRPAEEICKSTEFQLQAQQLTLMLLPIVGSMTN
jgi:hypothetical protein